MVSYSEFGNHFVKIKFITSKISFCCLESTLNIAQVALGISTFVNPSFGCFPRI